MGPKNIFICYRRDDAEGYAGRVFDRLNYRFPRRVFMDVTGIRPGADFSRVIQDTVGSCHVLIAIIGRHWATITDDSKQRRLDLPDDYVRHEIATALRRNITVIPVLVRGAQMPSSSLLPPDLAPLSTRNALEITDGDFDHDAQRLIEAIEIACGEPRPSPPVPIQPARSNCLLYSLIGIIAVGAVGIVLFVLGLLAASNQNTSGGGTQDPQPSFTSQPPAPATGQQPAETPEPETTQQPAVVSQFPNPIFGQWRLHIETADGGRNVFELDIFADGTYQSNTGHSGAYSYSINTLELEDWGIIFFKIRNGNMFIGHGTLNGVQVGIALAPR